MAESVTVNIAVQDAQVSQAGFGTPLILELHTAFTDRTKSYGSTTEIAVDFATTTKVYKAAAAIFAQSPSPETVKVGRIDAGDADVTESLNNIKLVDNDWYVFGLISMLTADITAAAAWSEANEKILAVQSEDVAILTTVTTDLFSVLKAASYNRTYSMFHHQSGVDSATGNSVVVASLVATVTKVAHGLLVNDPITIDAATDTDLNGNNIVASVIDADNFTFATTAIDNAVPDTGMTYFARYTFPALAWAGKILPDNPGVNTWMFKVLAGISATPTTIMNSSELAIVQGKNGNIYIDSYGTPETQSGIMASGRFIDVQRGSIDWLKARLSEAIKQLQKSTPKIPFTNAGGTMIKGAMKPILELAIERTVINPLDEDNGIKYNLYIPKTALVPDADKLIRKWSGITFRAKTGNAVHDVIINGTLEI